MARILVTIAIASIAARADARCDGPVALTRTAVQAACCTGAASQSAYRSCVRSTVADLVSGDALPASCASHAKKCLFKSACGRPGYATCCRASSNGIMRCRIRKPADCLARGGCVGQQPTCCDSCGIGGCATTTSTPATTTSTTSTSTTMPAPGCGNGIVEPGEMCDGQPECGVDCKLHVQGCCSASGLCLEANPSLGSQAHFASNSCYMQGGTATWGTTCVPGDPSNCPSGPDGIVCGSCEPAPFQPMTVCCQESATCTQETITSGYGLVNFGESCGFDLGGEIVMLGTCGADGRCVPQP